MLVGFEKPTLGVPRNAVLSSLNLKPEIMRPGANPNKDPMKPPVDAEDATPRTTANSKRKKFPKGKVPAHKGTSTHDWDPQYKREYPHAHMRYHVPSRKISGIGSHPMFG